MNSSKTVILTIVLSLIVQSCQKEATNDSMNIIFLHHSTGANIWRGSEAPLIVRIIGKFSTTLSWRINENLKARLPQLFKEYNKFYNKNYNVEAKIFPKSSPYGWHNFPYDYYNIWVKNAGNKLFMEEPTLEILTKDYQVIIFKHCFPVSNINIDQNNSDINSDYKSLSNYKFQYLALREKLHEFPNTKFILFTGAVQVKAKLTENEASRAKEFFTWVINEWDIQNDNIFLWDLYTLQTEGGLFFKNEYAVSSVDSHPNDVFSGKAVGLLFNRIIDVIENNGSKTTLIGSFN